MTSSLKNRVRLSIEDLEQRDTPGTLTFSPPGWGDLAKPGLAKAEDHSGGVVQWSLGDVEAIFAKLAAAKSHDRPFHAVDAGSVVINGDPFLLPGTTITASASGQATHLGDFTLNDTSTVVRAEGAIRYIEGEAVLTADNGDLLYASFTGTLDLTTFKATVTFEWEGGTGRFADATGIIVWQVTVNPEDLTYTAVADGDINY